MAEKDINQHRHDKAVNQLLGIFQESNVDLDTFQATALQAGSNFIYDCIVPALRATSEYVKDIDSKHTQTKATEVLAYKLEVLKSLAAVSPSFREQMKRNDLLEIETKQLLANKAKQQALKALLDYALEVENLKKMHIELESSLRAFYVRQDEEAQLQAQKLRSATGMHHKTAMDEYTNLGSSAIDAKRSNSIFDPVKVIGHLLASLYYLHYKAPLKNLLYPNASFSHKAVALDDEPQRALNRKRFGGDLAPVAGGPVAAAPTMSGPK